MYWTIITLRTYLSMTYINLDIRILHTLMYQVDLCYTDTIARPPVNHYTFFQTRVITHGHIVFNFSSLLRVQSMIRLAFRASVKERNAGWLFLTCENRIINLKRESVNFTVSPSLCICSFCVRGGWGRDREGVVQNPFLKNPQSKRHTKFINWAHFSSRIKWTP